MMQIPTPMIPIPMRTYDTDTDAYDTDILMYRCDCACVYALSTVAGVPPRLEGLQKVRDDRRLLREVLEPLRRLADSQDLHAWLRRRQGLGGVPVEQRLKRVALQQRCKRVHDARLLAQLVRHIRQLRFHGFVHDQREASRHRVCVLLGLLLFAGRHRCLTAVVASARHGCWGDAATGTA